MPVTDPATRELIQQLFTTARALEARFPGRHFTPDGHMVGSLGEAIAADLYDLALEEASNEGYDATDAQNRKVEIKATFGDRGVAISGDTPIADRLIVLKLHENGNADTIYDGPAAPAWEVANKPSKTGQRHLSLSKLRRLQPATVYGLPTYETFQAAERGEVRLGGCIPPVPDAREVS